MKLPPAEPELGIPNMMPLIDIIFLLLIFFLMASSFKQAEKDLPVNLPEAAVSAQPLASVQELIVNITSQGQYIVAQQQYSEEQLATLLREAGRNNPHCSVTIRGDANSAWKHGVRVMGLCNKANIKHYFVAALPERSQP